MKRILKLAMVTVVLSACQAQMRTTEPNKEGPAAAPAAVPVATPVPAAQPVEQPRPAPTSPSPDIVRRTNPESGSVRTMPVSPRQRPQRPSESIRLEADPIQQGQSSAQVTVVGNCVCQEHVQETRQATNKIDILFVTDTSHSLFKEREDVANGIDEFIARLPKDIDYRVALMPAHGSTSNLTGRLFTLRNEPRVLSSTAMNGQAAMSQAAIRSALRERIVNVPPDARESDRGEEGLYSLSMGLKFPNSKESVDAGFFRKDAALAVIFFSDENDICAEYPAGVTPKKDPQGMEDRARARDCKGITAKGIYDRLVQIKGNMPLSVNGILYTDQSQINNADRTDAYSDENEIGYGYLDLIRLSNGLAIPLGSPIGEGLSHIGEKMNVKLFTSLEYPLLSKTYQNEQIDVYIDGVKQPRDSHYYQRELREIKGSHGKI